MVSLLRFLNSGWAKRVFAWSFDRSTLLFLLFLLGLILRIMGTNPGYLNHPDEPKIADAAMNITFHLDFVPVAFYYGSLLPIVYALFNFAVVLPLYFLFYVPFSVILAITNQGDWGIVSCFLKNGVSYCLTSESKEFFSLLTRYETALLSSFSVVLIYHLGKRLFNKNVGLVAAIFTAVNYRHVLSSHFALADAPLAVFVIFSMFLNLRLLKRRSLGNYILAGLGLGLIFSVKYFVYTIPTFFLCHVFGAFKLEDMKSRFSALVTWKVVVAIVVAFTVFAVINPYVFLDYQNAKEQFALNAMFYRTSVLSLPALFSFNKFQFFSVYYLFKYGLGGLVSVAALFGFFVSFFKYPKATVILSSVIVPFFYFFFIVSGATYVRNYSAVLPLLTLFVGVAVDSTVGRVAKGKRVLVVLLCALLAYAPMRRTLTVSYAFAQTPSYKLLENWLLEHSSDDLRIVKSWGTPFPGSRQVDLDWEPYSTGYQSLSELIDSKTDLLILSTRSGVYINDSLNLAGRNEIVEHSLFDSKVFWGFLENNYVSLLTRELAQYRVVEFVKPTEALDPSFLVVKIPSFQEYAFKIITPRISPVFNITPKCIDSSKNGRQNTNIFFLSEVVLPPEKLYRVSADIKIRLDPAISYYRSKFIRADFYAADNRLLKTSVSNQVRVVDGREKLTLVGATPSDSKRVVLSFQSDECARSSNESYQLENLIIEESADIFKLDPSTYSNFNSSLSKNFIWLPPL